MQHGCVVHCGAASVAQQIWRGAAVRYSVEDASLTSDYAVLIAMMFMIFDIVLSYLALNGRFNCLQLVGIQMISGISKNDDLCVCIQRLKMTFYSCYTNPFRTQMSFKAGPANA